MGYKINTQNQPGIPKLIRCIWEVKLTKKMEYLDTHLCMKYVRTKYHKQWRKESKQNLNK